MKLAQDALYVENVLLGNVNGGQDSTLPPLVDFTEWIFEPNDVKIKTINVSEQTISELEARLCFVTLETLIFLVKFWRTL